MEWQGLVGGNSNHEFNKIQLGNILSNRMFAITENGRAKWVKFSYVDLSWPRFTLVIEYSFPKNKNSCYDPPRIHRYRRKSILNKVVVSNE